MEIPKKTVIVLGLGNILYGDEGFGVRVAERLFENYDFAENVEIVDGGTQGHHLLIFVERATHLLLLDSVDFGLTAGTLVVRDSTGIPAYLSAHKMSLHQNSFSEVLALAELRDAIPHEIALIGMQPVDLNYAHSLSPHVHAQLDAATALALAQLESWEIHAIPHTEAATPKHFQDASISLKYFENKKESV